MIRKGFTIIELLVVMAIIGILASVMVIAVNPAHQFAAARDTERQSDLYAILSAVYQYSGEHSGSLPDTDGDPNTSNFPTTRTCIGTVAPCFNLAGAGDSGQTIVPVYMPNMPHDPKTGNDQDTGYFIYVDPNGHLVASASGEIKTDIGITR